MGAGAEAVLAAAGTAVRAVAGAATEVTVARLGPATATLLATVVAAAVGAAPTRGAAARRTPDQVRRRAGGLEPLDGDHRNRLGGVVLDALDHRHVAALGQRDGAARAAGAAGAADAVHVVLGLERQTVVDDVGDGGHVNAARGHVGGHQDAQMARAQTLQHAVAPALRHAAVQRRHRVAQVGQAVGQAIGIDLGAGEHHGLVHIAFGQQVVQQGVLVVEVVGPQDLLGDVLVLLGVRGDLDALDIVLLQALGQAADFTGEGGAGHQGLAVARQALGDVLDVLDEAHVEHAVGFVEHQHLDVVEHGLAALQVVDQAAGRGDQDVQRAAQGLDLGRIGHATHDAGDGEPLHMAAVVGGSLGDLHRQLAGGHQHQDARALDLALLGLVGRVLARGDDLHQRRQHERGGLAAAGAGAHAQVLAGQCRRNGLGLDVGGLLVAGGGQGADEAFVEAEGFETHENNFQWQCASAGPARVAEKSDARGDRHHHPSPPCDA